MSVFSAYRGEVLLLMKSSIRASVFFLLLFASAGAGQSETLPSGFRLHLRALRITHLDSTGVQAEALMSIVPGASAEVEQIRFRNMQVAGIPVVVAPLSQVDLHRGREAELPSMHMTTSPGSLDAVAALLRLERSRTVILQGEVTMVVRPGLLQHLLLHGSDLQVIAVVHEEAPLDLSGLAAAGLSMTSGVGSSLLTLAQSVLRRVASSQAAPNLPSMPDGLLHVASCTSFAVCTDFLAFRILDENGAGSVMTAAEAGDPWAFSATMRMSFRQRPAQPVQVRVESIVAANSGTPAQRSMQPVSFRRTAEPPSFHAIVLPAHHEQTFASRTAPGCFGVLGGVTEGDAFKLASAEERAQPTWNNLIVFRLVHTVAAHWSWKPLWVSGKLSNGMIVLNGAAESATVGSPVLFQGKVIALVQDENLATTL